MYFLFNHLRILINKNAEKRKNVFTVEKCSIYS